ncbi:MAG: glycosyltransferase [Deltaproteobacteria bacterium]|nr:glycosyltransferase [Deltaproteobacteria bacterium]
MSITDHGKTARPGAKGKTLWRLAIFYFVHGPWKSIKPDNRGDLDPSSGESSALLAGITDLNAMFRTKLLKKSGIKMINMILNAEQLVQKGNFKEAYDAFNDIISKDTTNLRALMGFGVVCFKLTNYQESICTFRKILEIKDNHIEALKSLATVLAAEKLYDECMVVIDKLLSVKKRDPESLAFAAGVFNGLGKTDQAMDKIESALELTRNNYIKQAEFTDIKSIIMGLPKPSKIKNKPIITVCCVPGMDNFIHELIKLLSPYAKISASVSTNSEDHVRAIRNSNTVWLEWGNQLTKFLLDQKALLNNKKVIVRIHNYEVHDNLVDSLDFTAATDIVFVASYLRDLFLKKHLPTISNCKIHVIHNGIDTRRFKFVPRTDSKKDIAFLAYISYKKDPMVLLHAFAFLAKRHPEIRLHIAGMFQDRRYEIGMPHFIQQAGLTEKVHFYGHINNADEWLTDKDFIFSSSLLESQGVGILEAMSRGCRPLTYNFPGARDLYLPNQLWTTFDDLEDRFLNGPEPKEVSDFVAKYYTRAREVGSWLKMILNNEQVEEEFDFSKQIIDV